MGGLTDNNNENANLLIIAYQYFSYSVLVICFYHKNTAKFQRYFLSKFYELTYFQTFKS
ncbi:hypothetical protein JCM18903_606 [Psychrobacter sp. JCM 18903]|nr:hypothetical protein JCM18903_606 [Psychrobacter sp. JCM 18903]